MSQRPWCCVKNGGGHAEEKNGPSRNKRDPGKTKNESTRSMEQTSGKGCDRSNEKQASNEKTGVELSIGEETVGVKRG